MLAKEAFKLKISLHLWIHLYVGLSSELKRAGNINRFWLELFDKIFIYPQNDG